jgi:hypothetical protein
MPTVGLELKAAVEAVLGQLLGLWGVTSDSYKEAPKCAKICNKKSQR